MHRRYMSMLCTFSCMCTTCMHSLVLCVVIFYNSFDLDDDNSGNMSIRLNSKSVSLK